MNYNQCLEIIFKDFINDLIETPQLTFPYSYIVENFKKYNIQFEFKKVQRFFETKGLIFCNYLDDPITSIMCFEEGERKYTITNPKIIHKAFF